MQAGGEVALAGNITCDDSASAPLVVSSGVSVTLDLAGFTIDRNMSEPSDSGASIISNHGTLTITDISAGQTGSIRGGKSDQGGYGAIYNDGTLTIEGGTFANNSAQAYGAILNRGNLYLSGSPSFNNNAYSDSKYEDVYLDNGAIITLDGNLDESVRVAVGSSAASSASFVITFGLPDYGSISNFVSSREGFALGTSSESSTKGEAMLGVPHGVTIDSGIANGQVSVDKEQAIAGESVKLAAEPVSGYELGSYVVTDSAGADVDVSSDGTFIMPASGVTVSAAFTFAVSWFRNYPEVGWNRIDGVDTYGHYKVRVLKADGVTPLTDWQEQVYYETDFDITDLMAEHGSGTYSVEVEAYDSDNKLIATGKSSQKAFHKLDFEIETLC